MRYLVGFVSVLLALGVLGAVGCGEGEEPRIPCEYSRDCPPPDDECLNAQCLGDFCRHLARQHGAGCELNDGSMGVCRHDVGCVRTSERIPCKHGYDNRSEYRDGTLCRSTDGLEGSCFDGVCGGEHFCEGVVCDEPDNLCEIDSYCSWEGTCEFRQVTDCFDGSTCTFDECDPNKGCVYTRRPNGADCVLRGNELCCLFSLGWGECCYGGSCADGICRSRE